MKAYWGFVACLPVFLMSACSPRSTLPPAALPTPTLPSQLVDVGGHKLWIECAGTSSPTVILEGGLGVYSGTWYKVMPDVAKFTHVCRYDRAGLGLSEPGPKPRTSEVMIQELHALLANAQIRPPYVLVGHSFAGLNIHLLASSYPQEVAGLVFVDALPPDFDAGIEQILTPEHAKQRRSDLELNQEGIKFEDILTSESQVKAAGPVPNVPLIVIRHGIPFDDTAPESPQIERLWARLQDDLAKLTPQGKVIIAKNSQHRIQETEPDVVAAAIREVVEAARR